MQRFPTLFAFEAKTSVGLYKCPVDGSHRHIVGPNKHCRRIQSVKH